MVIKMRCIVYLLIILLAVSQTVWAADGSGSSSTSTPGQLNAQPAVNLKNSIAEIARVLAEILTILGAVMLALVETGKISDPNIKAQKKTFLTMIIFGGLIYFVAENDTLLQWAKDFMAGFFQ